MIVIGYDELIDIDCEVNYSIKNVGYNYQNMMLNKLIYEQCTDEIRIEFGKIIYSVGEYEDNKIISFSIDSKNNKNGEILRFDYDYDDAIQNYFENSTKGACLIAADYYSYIYKLYNYKNILNLKVINTNKDYIDYYSHYFENEAFDKTINIIDEHL